MSDRDIAEVECRLLCNLGDPDFYDGEFWNALTREQKVFLFELEMDINAYDGTGCSNMSVIGTEFFEVAEKYGMVRVETAIIEFWR